MRLRPSLGTVADITVIVAAATFIVLSAQGYFRWRVANRPLDRTAEQLVGRRLPFADLKASSSNASVVLILGAQCKHCRDSVEFYRRLATIRKEGRYGLVAVFGDGEAGNQFLKDHEITVDQMIIATPRSIGASGTPTVLVVDRTGTVQGAWMGRLPAKEEERVLEAVRKLSIAPARS